MAPPTSHYGAAVHLETERLLLPPLGRQHADELAEIYADPEVARYIGGSSLDAARTAAQAVGFEEVWETRGYGQSAVIVRETGAFVGRVGLHPWPVWDEVELGWVIARRAQRRGYASEAAAAWLRVAFGDLGLPRVTAVIHPENQRSRALAERLGFRFHRAEVTPGATEVMVFELCRPSRR